MTGSRTPFRMTCQGDGAQDSVRTLRLEADRTCKNSLRPADWRHQYNTPIKIPKVERHSKRLSGKIGQGDRENYDCRGGMAGPCGVWSGVGFAEEADGRATGAAGG